MWRLYLGIIFGTVFGITLLSRFSPSAALEAAAENNVHHGRITPLLDAVSKNQIDQAQMLLRRGALADDPAAARSALVVSVTNLDGNRLACNIPMLTLLLDNGADPNRIDPMTGELALHVAIGIDDPQCAEVLIARGARPDTIDSAGETIAAAAVLAAANHTDLAILDFAPAHGVPLTARDRGGATALHHAVWDRANVSIVDALLSRGVDPCLNATNWGTALDAAQIRKSSADVVAAISAAAHCS